MSKRKSITAATAALWFCESGHLHISLMDDDGDEIAGTALEMEDGMEVVADLLVELDEDHGVTLHSISEDDDDEGDESGPTVGSC